jgi:polysaccharide export outer membrane protein
MKYFLGIILLGMTLQSCRVYNQNIMFKTTENIISARDSMQESQASAERNYLIQKNDYIEVRVFTDSGEVIIDPPRINSDIQNQGMNQGMNQGLNQGQQIGVFNDNTFPLQFPNFLVQQDGLARIPKIGEIQLDGLTLDQAERILERRFSEFYPGAFVRTRYTNKRIFVFKGNTGLVLPLRNEKISLIDVLAQTGGVADNMRASNIRLVRGDLRDPTIKVINLRTYAGLTEHDLTIEANDIIYVEPVRKSFLEALRDISPILGFLSTTLTLILLIRRN